MTKKFIILSTIVIMLFAVVGLTACNNETNGSYSDYCCPQYRYNHDFCLTFEISHTTFRRRDASDVRINATLQNFSGESHYIWASFLFWTHIEGRGVVRHPVDIPPPTKFYLRKDGYIEKTISVGAIDFRRSGRFQLKVDSSFELDTDGTHIRVYSNTTTINVT